MLTAVTTAGAGTAIECLPGQELMYRISIAGTGAISATVALEWSHNNVDFTTLRTETVSGTTSASSMFVCKAHAKYIRANLTAVSGTGCAVTVKQLVASGAVIFPAAASMPVTSVAAAGSSNADAAALSAGVNHVTAADATKGVILPTAAAGLVVIVKNSDAADAVLKVYPGASDKINSGTATTGALSMAAKTSAMFVAISDVDWFTVPLLPS